ncbi:hypothetical protein E3A20_15270 [Planctomyces bekefii]|uniref:Uncharacterized protein n=1 Tax=Planctomyces bekefii TaxID=1653850 RepID=A0A5C6M5C5_9PLAN|nr:hypothetical protein E3A20_15270 [Planctomyces bekefii]
MIKNNVKVNKKEKGRRLRKGKKRRKREGEVIYNVREKKI